MSKNYINISVTSNDLDKRIDKFLTEKVSSISRNRLQSIISEKKVKINDQIILSPSSKIKSTGIITLQIPEPTKAFAMPQDIEIKIIYEDRNLIIIDKKAGMVVHPGAGNFDNTLVNALLHHCGNTLSGIGGVLRPGIVHRIDKMTSGLIVIAKNDQTHQSLSNQFKNKTVQKEYYLFCWGGFVDQRGSIQNYIIRSNRNRKKMTVSKNNTGRFASTDYEVLEEFQINDENYIKFIKCRLNTGRTHQIRVHMSHIGCPLLGDRLYGKQKIDKVNNKKLKSFIIKNFINNGRQALHAKKLGFYHPEKKERVTFETAFPSDFHGFLAILRKLTNEN